MLPLLEVVVDEVSPAVGLVLEPVLGPDAPLTPVADVLPLVELVGAVVVGAGPTMPSTNAISAYLLRA